jgi:hypothetical protein
VKFPSATRLIPKVLFADILSLIAELRPPPVHSIRRSSVPRSLAGDAMTENSALSAALRAPAPSDVIGFLPRRFPLVATDGLTLGGIIPLPWATSSRYDGRHHSVLVSAIISFWWAASIGISKQLSPWQSCIAHRAKFDRYLMH